MKLNCKASEASPGPLPGLGDLAGDDETLAWAGRPQQTDAPEVAQV